MRTILLAIATMLTVGVGVAFAQSSTIPPAQLEPLYTQYSYEACLALARQRGFAPGSTEERSGVFVFIDDCLAGNQN